MADALMASEFPLLSKEVRLAASLAHKIPAGLICAAWGSLYNPGTEEGVGWGRGSGVKG